MKSFIHKIVMLSALTSVSSPILIFAQDSKANKLIADCETSKAAFTKADSLMTRLFSSSPGYVIFPNVGKGAVGVGGASGNGILFESSKAVGKADLKQVNVGFQFGGQAYREVIFFQDQNAVNHFKQGKLKFSAQASAIAVKSGASTNVKFTEGVMVFTQGKGGLMYEAAIGGQKFGYSSF